MRDRARGLVHLAGRAADAERARRELESLDDAEGQAFLRDVPTWILDGNAYTSRPGPRVVKGAERMQAAFRGEETAGDGLERWGRPAIT